MFEIRTYGNPTTFRRSREPSEIFRSVCFSPTFASSRSPTFDDQSRRPNRGMRCYFGSDFGVKRGEGGGWWSVVRKRHEYNVNGGVIVGRSGQFFSLWSPSTRVAARQPHNVYFARVRFLCLAPPPTITDDETARALQRRIATRTVNCIWQRRNIF